MFKRPAGFKKAAKQLDRLYRERESYLDQAEKYRVEAVELFRKTGRTTPAYTELMSKAQDAAAWAVGMQSQINQAGAELADAIGGRGDW